MHLQLPCLGSRFLFVFFPEGGQPDYYCMAFYRRNCRCSPDFNSQHPCWMGNVQVGYVSHTARRMRRAVLSKAARAAAGSSANCAAQMRSESLAAVMTTTTPWTPHRYATQRDGAGERARELEREGCFLCQPCFFFCSFLLGRAGGEVEGGT